MNLDQIATRIARPETSQGSEIPALRELAEKYPYAQVFSILYLKALSNQNDIGFDEALQKHAYKVTDRMKLYDLIHERGEAVADSTDETVTSQAAVIPAVTSLNPSSGGETTLDPIEEDEVIEADFMGSDTHQEVVSEADLPVPTANPYPSAGTSSVEEKSDPDPVVTSPDPAFRGEATLDPIEEDEVVEADYVAGANEEAAENDVADQTGFSVPRTSEDADEETPASEMDASPAAKPETTEVPITESDLTPEFITDELELEIISQVVATVYNDNLEHSVPERKAEENEVEEKKSEPLIIRDPAPEGSVTESKRSFSSWLKAGTSTEPKAVAEAEGKLPEAVVQPEKPAEKQVNKIIDEFIEKEPTISRPRKEFYSPTKKAKESISSEGLIYTETLADIFAIQGNFPKAIKAYEQLMLTNPEKKIFFAQRIKELKEKLNT